MTFQPFVLCQEHPARRRPRDGECQDLCQGAGVGWAVAHSGIWIFLINYYAKCNHCNARGEGSQMFHITNKNKSPCILNLLQNNPGGISGWSRDEMRLAMSWWLCRLVMGARRSGLVFALPLWFLRFSLT